MIKPGSRFLRFPLVAEDGALATSDSEANALIASLQVACDLSPSEFLAIPEFSNLTMGIEIDEHETVVDIGSEIAKRLQRLVVALGRPAWVVDCNADKNGEAQAKIEVAAPAWSLFIPIVLRDSIVLDFGNAKIHGARS